MENSFSHALKKANVLAAGTAIGLVRAVRKVNATVPIIASTGLLNAHGDGDRAATLRELGVQQFLYKPFQNEDLLAALHRAIHPDQA